LVKGGEVVVDMGGHALTGVFVWPAGKLVRLVFNDDDAVDILASSLTDPEGVRPAF
jgi:hypothetical protein